MQAGDAGDGEVIGAVAGVGGAGMNGSQSAKRLFKTRRAAAEPAFQGTGRSQRGTASEGLLALKDGEWVVLRVPYPLGSYTKWMDGCIDDPNAGWKGKGLWATYSTRAPFHLETGKGTPSKW